MLTFRVSDFRTYRQSPYKFAKRKELGSSKQAGFGTLAHAFCLQYDEINELVVTEPEYKKKEKKDDLTISQQKQDFLELNKNKIIAKSEDIASCEIIRENLFSNNIIRDLFTHKDAHIEKTLYKEFDEYRLQGTPDIVIPSMNMIIDLKTTSDCRKEAFSRTVGNYEYFIQSYGYKLLCEHNYNTQFDVFMWVVVENKEPFIYSFYYMHEDLFELGKNCYDSTLPKMLDSYKNNNYPSLMEEPGDIIDISAYKKFEYKLRGELDE